MGTIDSSEFCHVADVHLYFGAVRALAGVDMHIDRGEILGIVGGNGSGKSTLINCLSGYLHVTKGRIRWLGEDITSLGMHRIARRGLVRTFQRTMVFRSGTVSDNLNRAFHIAEAVGNARRKANLPADVEGLLHFCNIKQIEHRPAATLSQGESRLLGVALALTANPLLVLLDEPAAGLNDYACDDLAALLRRVRNAGVTIAVVDHHMGFVMPLVDRLVVLNAGVKLAEGPPREVVERQDVMEAYLGHRLAQLALQAWRERSDPGEMAVNP